MKKLHVCSEFLLSYGHFVLLFFVLLFVGVRIVNLSVSPPGFYVDESAIAYNAYSILQTGKDEYGTWFPTFFKSFGDYKNGLYVYSQIPFIFLFGLNTVASRLTSAVWGLATIVVFFFLVRSRNFSIKKALFASFLFLCNPWHFQLSRVTFELISYPFFLISACFCLWEYQKSLYRSRRWFYLFSVLIGVSIYSYTSARLLSPLLFTAGIVFYWRFLNIRQSLISFLLMISTVVPMAFWEWMNPGTLLARYDVVGLHFSSTHWLEFCIQVIQNYATHFDPHFLFLYGDGYLRHSPAWHSVFFWSTIPFLLAGIYATLKHRQRFSLWVLLGFLLSPLPAALTQQAPHALRSIGMLPFALCLMAFGIEELSVLCMKKRWLWIPLTTGVFLESIFFLFFYTTVYTKNAQPWFDTDIHALFHTAFLLPEPYFISPVPYSGNYVTGYFLLHAPPREVQEGTYSRLSLFDSTATSTFSNGTYIFDKTTCAQLPSAFLTRANRIPFENENCIYVLGETR